jgi:acyl-CoA synthetase (AMP-forming)/AMP-acid ligase II
VPNTGRIEDALLRWRTESASGMLVDGERQLDHGGLALWALDFAARLTREGVAPGERVAIHLDHGLESVVALHGAWLAGALAVPVNQTLRSPQVAHILNHSGCRVLVSTPHKLAQLDESALHGAHARSRRLRFARGRGVRRGPAAHSARRPRAGGDPLHLGLHGRPKGILVSHANLCAGARIVSAYLGLRRRRAHPQRAAVQLRLRAQSTAVRAAPRLHAGAAALALPRRRAAQPRAPAHHDPGRRAAVLGSADARRGPTAGRCRTCVA